MRANVNLNDIAADDLRRIYVRKPNDSRLWKYMSDYELPRLNMFVIFSVFTRKWGTPKCRVHWFLKSGGERLFVKPRAVCRRVCIKRLVRLFRKIHRPPSSPFPASGPGLLRKSRSHRRDYFTNRFSVFSHGGVRQPVNGPGNPAGRRRVEHDRQRRVRVLQHRAV